MTAQTKVYANNLRQFPRREYNRKVGVLCRGTYMTCDAIEIGEGGMSFLADFVLTVGNQVVVSLQIPNGSFVALRATVRAAQVKMGDSLVTHGLIFSDVDLAIKRQIRAFVSLGNDGPSSAA